MSESILERIALWHAAAVAEITVAGGYQQTLSVTRPQELEIAGSRPEGPLLPVGKRPESAADIWSKGPDLDLPK